MEARGSLNGHQNAINSWKIRDLLSGALQGRVLGGFWVDLGRIMGWFGRDLGGPESPKGDQNQQISWTFRHPVPGGLQGRVWGGSWMDLGRILGGFCRDLGGFREDFEWNLGWFSIKFSKDF